MITEVVLGTGLVALMLLAGGEDGGAKYTDKQRNALWQALCAQWKNGAEPPAAHMNAIAASGLPDTSRARELAAEFWSSIEKRSGGIRTVCPPPPWTEEPTAPGGFAPIPTGPGGDNPYLDVLDDYIREAPGPNSMLAITKKNGAAGLSGVAAAVVKDMGVPNTGANRITVMKALALSKWNLPYRLPRAKSYWTVERDGVIFDARGAFYPANVDAVTAIAQGELPRRNLAWNTKVVKTGAGSSYGMLYIPDFTTFDNKVIAPSADPVGKGMLPTGLMQVLGKTAADIVP